MADAPPLERLAAALAAPALGLDAATRVAVAFSGGLDSVVLLHGLKRLTRVASVRALHIDHGLHAESVCWAEHCRAIAAALGVPIDVRRIEVPRQAGRSLEEAARDARYAALARLIRPGEVLATAHQADDQLETLLYRFVRGTGIRGLRGIAERTPLGEGFIARPLLAMTRAEIRAVADEWRLDWIDDPSNLDRRFDRNYLRLEVVPRLLERWPRAPDAARRLAQAARDAERILTGVADRDIATCGDRDRLELAAFARLSPERQRNALRHAANGLGLGTPDARHLAGILALVDSERARGCVQWPGGEAHRYRGHLYLRPRLGTAAAEPARLRIGARVALAEGGLELVPTDGAGLPRAWLDAGLEVVFRRGAERFRPAGAARARPLNQWFQQHAIVPWMRDRIPLILHEREIVAIADLALGDAATRTRDADPRWRIVWHDRPRLT